MMEKLNLYERLKFSRQAIPLNQLNSNQFPIIVKITSCEIAGSAVTRKEILRINHVGYERRVLAVDSLQRIWNFPIHTGMKFDIIGKTLENRKSVFMREIIECGSSKRAKKIRFSESQVDTAQIHITGQDEEKKLSDMVIGDFKIKDVTQVRYYAGNRIVDDEISPKVVILPSSLDIHVTMATGLVGMPASAMMTYMNQLSNEINSWVNFDMCRGSSDILFYTGIPKSLKGKKTLNDLAKLNISPKIVRISKAYRKSRGLPRPKQTTSAGDGGNISGSAMANMMASSRGESFKNSEAKSKNALQWLRTVDTSHGTASATSVITGDEDMSEEERQAMIRARRRLLMSLDDYGYGSEQDTPESRSGDHHVNGDDDQKEDENGGDHDHDIGNNVSEATESGVDVESREDVSVASSSSKIDVPVVVEQADGSHRVVTRRERSTRRKSTRRFGGYFKPSMDLIDGYSSAHGKQDTEEPVLRQSSNVPFEMSSSYFSLSKKWIARDSGSEQSETPHAMTKRESNFRFFTFSRSRRLDDQEGPKRRSSDFAGSADIEDEEHLSYFMRFLELQGDQPHID
ncbi:uncharacterized protein LOC129253542 [Lytechinus pictus]|uniref:uncharacterized protein LOC129253542 n=1 Tax=Lytechinus pictus TaxID=7653 RepID=UPI0030B9B663